MLHMLWGWIKKLVWIELELAPEQTKQEEIPKYRTPDRWVFGGPPPTNAAIHKLYLGMETHGEHIFYRNPDTGNFSRGLHDGAKTWNVRLVIFWLTEQELDPKQDLQKVKQTCGSDRCILAAHLEAVYEPSGGGCDSSALPASTGSAPPVYKPRTIKRKGLKDRGYTDRTRCVSAKIWFPTKEVAQKEASDYNKNRRPKGGRHLYGYDCDWCDGGHLTKQDPKKRAEYKHAGSW